MSHTQILNSEKAPENFTQQIIEDYKIAYQSRQASLLGRKEVLTGKAKFGIFGDGKEVAQLAMAKVFKKGDFRSGYYRDQTFMFALGLNTIQQFFAQLYAHPDLEADPNSGGRSMNGHFSSHLLDQEGKWIKQTEAYNVSADISPTAGQMPRLLGLAYASKIYRNNPELHEMNTFSIQGNEIAFGTIGNASTSEGGFWEVINAAGVLQVPMLTSIWDDEYGISVPAKYQTTKEDLSEILSGFVTTDQKKGIHLFRVKGWDYAELCSVYEQAAELCRTQHMPVVIHVVELTQPQGHSTSGSHERYKSQERLQWELDYDCLVQMRKWILEHGFAKEEELQELERNAVAFVKEQKDLAWKEYLNSLEADKQRCLKVLQSFGEENTEVFSVFQSIQANRMPIRKELLQELHRVLRITASQPEWQEQRQTVQETYQEMIQQNEDRYGSHLLSQSAESVFNQHPINAVYTEESQMVDGREVLQACFDYNLGSNPLVLAFGEDVGKIGDVNQGFAGLQDKYGEIRVTDTGIRELSIIGQGIGASMRGLRPIAEIQYLDYLLYALQIMSDDIATLQYRTVGRQKAPLIIRTRGHRLEGIWHSGSPMGMIINAVRGMHVCVPRNMTQAAGMYNLLLKSDEPALVVECLNGYRLKEKMPINIGVFTVPLGMPEVLAQGNDITLVTYGSCVRIAEQAMQLLQPMGIQVELIDVQTLLPFDIDHTIVQSIQKTHKLMVLDEDVPGGASAYILQQILVNQKGFRYLDSEPVTITAKDHRPAYGTDGDYFSKPNAEDVFNACYAMMKEYMPQEFKSGF